MLLLLTIGLVLVATVALVIGFVTSALPPIYVSIACSVAAALVLFFFSRLSKREAQVPTSAGPAPLPGPTAGEAALPGSTVTVLGTAPSAEAGAPGAAAAVAGAAGPTTQAGPDADTTGEVPVVAAPQDEAFAPEGMMAAAETAGGAGASVAEAAPGARAGSPGEAAEGEAAEGGGAPVPGLAAVAAAAASADADEVGAGEDDVFPIAEYDDLRVSEILPLLPELDEDELQMVRQREQDGRARFSILTRLDQLSAQLRAATGVPTQGFEEDAAGVGVASVPLAPPPPPPGPPPGDWPEPPETTMAPPPAPDMAPADADMAVAAAAGQGQGVPAAEALDAGPSDVAAEPAAGDVSRAFPIADYDGKKVTEILPLLTNLGADDLATVAEKERSGKARGSVLSRIEQLQARAADTAPPPTAAKRVVEGGAAKKTAAKKAPAKKAAAGGTKAAAGKTAAAAGPTNAAKSGKAAKAPAAGKASSTGKAPSAAKAPTTTKAAGNSQDAGEAPGAAEGAEKTADGSAEKAPAKKASTRTTKKQ